MNSTTSAIAMTQAPSLVREYYELTKPGITQMVVLTTLTGYYLAIEGDVLSYASSGHNWLHFLATIVGTTLVSSGSCVLNHVLERRNDALMKRTAKRPIPAGVISVSSATWFSIILTVVGLVMLSVTNWLTVGLAIGAWLSYVAVYTPLKQRTTLSLLIGGIPGALPFAGGWTSVTGTFDWTATALFAILFFWQMPHFLALSWMYKSDYQEGGYAMHAVGDNAAQRVGMQTLLYSAMLLATLLAPSLLGITGMVYAIGAVALGSWLLIESELFRRTTQPRSARRVLLTSYAVLMGALLLMVIDKVTV
ncbi:MAG: heme o synthase [Bradyrhizobiaceae bacterium]|nr:heme o synthase [Bradyrhizobiaceae bacterium]